ncbi:MULTISPECIES: DUF3107 domain-containing protein [Paeniglutamicibacter]|uniref:DUF3107 domain-containing protein n=1 Tax=Paeniglutamicibacter sulfureus TaxID=43666 RepID=A0ABU2BQU2_9MICC|nr:MULTISPECIES: DUF3107 domain-containing protein [Paeniglutamicibacter]MCV9995684.1 DUF3107 domain-containing protein [Paeniglutamicibacter sp. ZC-3]MDO2935730.1 DUF3107 domain-containing protein [Paeniglutamicibacter sulfureus]MDR7360118.1 hypothetical protein [Paeniglutamicibacter sulfureus]
MDVRIGIQNVAREIVIESDENAEELAKRVSDALASGGELRLTDSKGRLMLVPVSGIAYVEIGVEEARRVGFAH